ncbi:prepilin peptidase [bacterium]|nr:prepilin peptidase [bacterium]
MIDLSLVYVVILGLGIGSFLNACIYRVPRKLSVAFPTRSFCPKCNKTILWWENIPVLSWFILWGKCSKCRLPISPVYPLVEVLSLCVALASYFYYGLTPTGVVVYLFSAALIVITFIDFEFKIIPDVIDLPGIIIGFIIGGLSQFLNIFEFPITTGLADSLFGFLAGGGFFFVIAEVYYRVTGKEGLGGGDIKLMAMAGSILGWRSIAPAIFVGSLLGSIIGIGLMFIKGEGRNLEIPFGPWLSAGILSYMFFDLPFFKF